MVFERDLVWFHRISRSWMDFFNGTGMKRHIPFLKWGTSKDLSQKSFKNPQHSDPYLKTDGVKK